MLGAVFLATMMGWKTRQKACSFFSGLASLVTWKLIFTFYDCALASPPASELPLEAVICVLTRHE